MIVNKIRKFFRKTSDAIVVGIAALLWLVLTGLASVLGWLMWLAPLCAAAGILYWMFF